MMGNVKRLGGRIVPDTVELYGETFWREETIDAHFVELEGALEGLISVIEATGLDNLSRGVQLGPTVWYVQATDALEIAKRVIAPPSLNERTPEVPEIEKLRAALTRLEQIYTTDRVAADQANEIETIFDKHLHSSVSEPAAPGDED